MHRFEKRDFEERQHAILEHMEDLTDALVAVSRSLVGAMSVIERTPECKKAVSSDRIFDQMLLDMKMSLERARKALH